MLEELLETIRELHRSGALREDYDIDDTVEPGGPALEVAITRWALAGYPMPQDEKDSPEE